MYWCNWCKNGGGKHQIGNTAVPKIRREKRSRRPRREVSSSRENPREKREEMKWDEDKMRRGNGKDEEGDKSRQIAVSVMTSQEQKGHYRE